MKKSVWTLLPLLCCQSEVEIEPEVTKSVGRANTQSIEGFDFGKLYNPFIVNDEYSYYDLGKNGKRKFG